MSDLIVSNNTAYSGGGVCIYGSTASPTMSNITITGNTSSNTGAGMLITNSSSPQITNITFCNNIASGNDAGAILSESSSTPTITNALIYKNTSQSQGAGIYLYGGTMTLINATVVYNTVTTANNNGAGIHVGNGTLNLKNSIIWGNTAGNYYKNVAGSINYSYCLLQNGTVNSPSIISNSNPRFVSVSADNYRLPSWSPAINVGVDTDNSSVTDLDGNTRKIAPKIDLGAYECQAGATTISKTRTIYVKKGATGANNGSSWTDALTELSDALYESENSGTVAQIWVAAGTYYTLRRPDTGEKITNDRNNSFLLQKDVKIYGGFAGAETSLSQRNISTNTTILSGDIGTVGNSTDNAYHIVISSGDVGSGELNGFTITGGYASDWNSVSINSNAIKRIYGAGIVCFASSPMLTNLIVQNGTASATGGGLYLDNASPALNNVTIQNNTENNGGGGGLYLTNGSSPTITNSLIKANRSTSSKGGGMHIAGTSSPTITSTTFDSNTASQKGGGIYNESSATILIGNSTFSNNKATSENGGAIANLGSSMTLTNVLVYKNTSGQGGAAIYSSNGTPTLVNATIVYNTAANGYTGGLNGNFTVKNSILWGNLGGSVSNNVNGTITYNRTLLEGGTVSLPSIISNTNPRFVSVSTDNYQISSWSPAVNAGDNSYNSTTTDLAGNTRTYDGTIDLGAYECQSAPTVLTKTRTIYVRKNANGNHDGSSWTNAFTELSDALDESDNTGTVAQIWVAAGTYIPTKFMGNGSGSGDKSFVLQKDVAIYGGFSGSETALSQRDWVSNPTILSGNSTMYHVVVSAGDVGTAVLDGFSITGASSNNWNDITLNSFNIKQSKGAGVHCNASSPIFRNIKIYSNSNPEFGAGIYCGSDSHPTFINVLIYKNSASNGGGGIYSDSSTPTLINCTIVNNTGGGSNGISGSATVNNSIIWNNSTSGSITYNYSLLQGGTVIGTNIVSNSDPLFMNSSSDNYRLQAASPAKNIGNNSFVSGIATDLDGKSRIVSTTVDLGAYEYLGVLYVKQGASGVNGLSWGDAFGELANAIVQANNSNTTTPGSITEIWVAAGTYYPLYKAGNGSSTRDQAFVLPANVKIYGGFAATETLLSQRNWTNNTTILSGDLGVVGDNTDNSYHVVISAGSVGTAELNGFTITGANANASSTITVNGSNTINQNNGGGVFCANSSPILSNLIITNNSTSNKGGGAYFTGSSPTVSATTFSSNSSVEGGGLYNTNASPSISNSFFYSNTATNGAGIYNKTSSPTLTGDSIYSNVAATSGGGIYNDSSSPSISNVSIYSNTATSYYGGGIYNESSSPTITNARIHNNSASNASNGNGGGVYNLSSSPSITNSQIYANSATNGAGLYNSASSPTLTGDSIFSNTASANGGGIHNASSSTATLTNVSIRSNTANSGGGIYNISSSPIITNSRIYQNTAALGSGFYNFGSTSIAAPVLTNVYVISNTSSDKGGGFYNVGADATHRSELVLKNVLIAGNTSKYDGGGIYNNNYTANTYTNVTLAGNATVNPSGQDYNGGGMYNNTPANCSEIFKNSIIWGNKKGASTASNIYNGTVTYHNCLLEGGSLSANSIVSIADPLFVNSSVGNYRIQGASPAYNAGDNTYINTVSTDLDGANRIKYTTVDLGAYEYNQTNKWVGSVSTDPANAQNWSQGSVLANNDVLEFDASAQRDLLLTADKSITYLYNHSSRVLNANGHKLTLAGNINQSTAISASTAGSSVEFAGTANQSIPSGMFTNDSICNLIINNAANVTLSGSLHLANNITATIGKLDAYTNSPSVYYSGQLLDGVFTNNRAYNLTLYNTSGYAPASDLVVGNNLVIGRNVTLTLNPGVLVNVAGSITNNNGVAGVLIKSSPSGANGSLIFHNASNNPLSATVEMYSKAFKDPNGPIGFKYKWQFFGIPLRSVQASPTFDGSYISEYNATSATSSWTSLANSALLTSFKGYEITQLAAKTISFQGILENADMNVNLAYNSGALYPGQHIISNPYTAAINITNISFTNCDGSVYQYNTGSKSDWSGYVGETTASNPGQYIASTPQTAGVGGIPATIPSMQGFLVKANAGGGNISYPYNSLTSKNSDPQRVKSNETATRVCAVVSVASAHYADKMWLFSDATCTNGFDAGWDAKKIRGTSVAPQLYAVEKDGEYQIDCKSTIVNTPICFKAGVDSVYSLKINGINLSQAYSTLYLVDSVANKVVSLQMDSTVYQFSATPNTSSTRFRIVESAGITTDSNPIEAECMKGSFYVNGGKLYVAEKCAANYMNIYTATGKLIRYLNKHQLTAKVIDLQLQGGTFLLKSSDGEAKVVVVE